jgi:hypothetical protein
LFEQESSLTHEVDPDFLEYCRREQAEPGRACGCRAARGIRMATGREARRIARATQQLHALQTWNPEVIVLLALDANQVQGYIVSSV